MQPPFTVTLRSRSGSAIGPDPEISVVPLPAAERERWRVRISALSAPWSGSIVIAQHFNVPQCPWFLLPGFFYGQGRQIAGLRYPGLRTSTAPSDAFIQSAWTVALERCSHPVVVARADGRWRGFDAEPHFRIAGCPSTAAVWGDDEPQIGLGLGWDGSSAHVAIVLPASEGPLRHTRNPRHQAVDKWLTLPAGAAVELDVGCWDYAGEAHAWYPIINRVYHELQTTHPAAVMPDRAELGRAAAHGLRAWHWVPAAEHGAPAAEHGVSAAEHARPGYFVYTAAMDRSVEFNANVNRHTSLGWHFEALGFVGGFAVAHALQWWNRQSGDQAALTIAEDVVERWCRDGVAPSGLLRTSYHPGKARTRHGEYANGNDTPSYGSCWQGERTVLHARTTADATFYLARFLAQRQSDSLYALGLKTLRGALTAALQSQRSDGRHPQRYHANTGAGLHWDGDAGLLWVAAMDAAHDLFADDPDFQEKLRASQRAAGHAYAAAVRSGVICGAPEDVSLAPTSEDGYNAIMAYARLYRREPLPEWLELWRLATEWTCSWRRAWNSRWPARSQFSAMELRTRGGDYASSNNNHLHLYGLNCLNDWHELSRITGDPTFSQRADDHQTWAAQLIALVDGQWNSQRGMCTEQFYVCDWSIWDGWDPGPDHVQKGTFMGFSHVWCINHQLLGLEQTAKPASG